jgi:hypothetical protein
MSRWCAARSVPDPAGLLPAEPTREVLKKMPVELIVDVMRGKKKEQVTFSAWDFAGQVRNI